jgi:ferric-dicitrate binding protein FerR (iron transport regulator)
MTPHQERLRFLFRRYLEATANPDEIQELRNLLSVTENQDAVSEDLWRVWDTPGAEKPSEEKDWQPVFEDIHRRIDAWELDTAAAGKKRSSFWYGVAATVAVLMAGAILLTTAPHRASGPSPDKTATAAGAVRDIAPGKSRAVLLLSNGKQIMLDSAPGGQLARQGNAQIFKRGHGILAYQLQGPPAGNRAAGTAPVAYDILKTPRGGQYHLMLSDGTRVWLNDSSSIRFPAVFQEDSRTVQITGEVYFEVAKDVSRPFRVQQDGITIEVLGTNFNVNAYRDENTVKVTLLEGSVKVLDPGIRLARIIRPGEQLQIDHKGTARVVEGVNPNQVIAWKNNLFWFEDDDIQTIMRQVSRWYDVNVEIQGDISQHFTGSIPRDIMVSGVFEVLRRTGNIRFRIQDDTIFVSP